MIDLHLHLDGSLSEEDYRFLASIHNVDLGNDFPNNIRVNNDCKSLNEYLEKFNLPLSLLQDEYSIAYAVKSLVNRLYASGYIYAEIRFAPLLHTQKGMSQEDAVISAIAGLNSALKDKPDFDANLILCCMRQFDYKENINAILLAEKYRNSKIVAVDLAGPEAFKDGTNYIDLFEEANKRNLNITIHAGEECGSNEVMTAINLLHAKRIGHGVHLNCGRDIIKAVTEKNISFEFCPTSNLQTKSLEDYAHVPLSEFLRYGINVTINSDNITVSNTDVYLEYAHLLKAFPIQPFEIKHLLLNSVDAAFVGVEEKSELKKKVESRFEEFYFKIANLAQLF